MRWVYSLLLWPFPPLFLAVVAERAKMRSQAIATLALVALVYPFFEGMVWNGNYGLQKWR